MNPEIPESRGALVEELRRQGIRDERVLEAMARLRREFFVPSDLRSAAYADNPLPIGYGQTISQPYIVALMTQALALDKADRILEIGTGSGYQTALLAALGGRVVSVERCQPLAERAAKRLTALGYHNVSVYVADGTLGWAPEAPFQAMVVTAGAPRVPPNLIGQLAEGGRLVIPVGPLERQSLDLLVKRDGALRRILLGPCRFVPLIGQAGWKEDSA